MLQGRAREYICFRSRPQVLSNIPSRSLTTPGMSAKSLYKCYEKIYLKPGVQNFVYESSLQGPKIVNSTEAVKELDDIPVQKGEGLKTEQSETTTSIPSEPKNKFLESDKKIEIGDILNKMDHPQYESETLLVPKKEQKHKLKLEPKEKKKSKKQKLEEDPNFVFRFY